MLCKDVNSIVQIHPQTSNVVRGFKNINEANKIGKFNKYHLKMLLDFNELNQVGGYFWKYLDDLFVNNKPVGHNFDNLVNIFKGNTSWNLQGIIESNKIPDIKLINDVPEKWKDVVGFKGEYKVSNYGRVISTKYYPYVTLRRQSINKGGYFVTNLLMNGRRYNKRVHRLVAEAFIPNPDNKPCVNHKNENKLINFVDNLEWCTILENNIYGTRIERILLKNSTPVYQIDKFKDKIIREFPSLNDVYKFFGKKGSDLSKVLDGRRKTFQGFKWVKKDDLSSFEINNKIDTYEVIIFGKKYILTLNKEIIINGISYKFIGIIKFNNEIPINNCIYIDDKTKKVICRKLSK